MNKKLLLSGTEESMLIYQALKIILIGKNDKIFDNLECPMMLKDYVHDNLTLPILLCGPGQEHGDSHNLSEKLKGAIDRDNTVKVVYDFHLDNKDVADPCASHLRKTISGQIYSMIYNVDAINNLFFPGLLKAVQIGTSGDPAITGEIKEKDIHLSVDLDLIREDYIDSFYNRGRIGIDVLLDSISALMEGNRLIALDVCGLSPYNSYDSSKRCALIKGVWRNNPTKSMDIYTGHHERYYTRVMAPDEIKEIAPSFNRGVQHYFRILSELLKSA